MKQGLFSILAKAFLRFSLLGVFFSFISVAFSADQLERLGLGMTMALKNNLPALSFKLQKSPSFAIGGLAGISTDKTEGGYGAGLKVYRIFFDEPQLTFYASAMGAMIQQKRESGTLSGFQFDLSLGPEFFFSGLPSLGLSFEFGISINKLDKVVFETLGNNFIVAAMHFYL